MKPAQFIVRVERGEQWVIAFTGDVSECFNYKVMLGEPTKIERKVSQEL